MTIAVVGIGETPPSFADPRSIAELAADATRLALADAGLQGSDVTGIVTEAMSFGGRVPADDLAHRIGMVERPFSASVGIAGSGTIGAAMLAEWAIESGTADVVVCAYALSLSARATGGGVYAVHAEEPAKAAFEMPMGYYGQPVYFAAQAQRYAHVHGVDPASFGHFAVSARRHARRTPNALATDDITFDDYLEARMVAEPLRNLDCCLVNDCGAAYVMTSIERARDLAKPPVVVAGVGFASKPMTQAQYFTQGDILSTPAIESGELAYRQAGLGPADVDLAEIYDCSTISAVLQLEDLGLAPHGESTRQARDGRFDPGGALPLNTHGGLLSQSYSVGVGHVVEATAQLRRERSDAQVPDAEVALVCGLGAPEHATMILTADR